jgi:methionyl-tRNA formyltransferase
MAPATGLGEPGTILSASADGVVVATGDGALRLITVQRPGNGRVAAAEVLRGQSRL